MAELINQIVSEEALKQVRELKSELGQTLEKFTANVNSAKILNTVLARADGMQATTDAIKKQGASLDEVEKLKKQLIATNQKLVASETIYNQLLLEERSKLNEVNAETRRHIKEKNAELGSYNQLEAQLSKMTKAYKSMSEAQRNSASGKDFLVNLQKTEAQLKSLDATMGSHKRNVGNYQNQLFGLTQVFREIPAFTYSAQTGILGLSNNLPILADNFSSVAKATNEVTGKVNGTAGALKIFASSIFSFGNVFAIAIGLFTIFSKQIFEFFSNTKKAVEVTDELAKATAKEAASVEVLKTAIEDVNLPMSKRIDAINELKKTFPDYFKDISNEILLTGQAADAYDRLTKSLVRKARANVAMEKVQKLVAQIMQAEVELAKKLPSVGGVDSKGFPIAPTTAGGMAAESMQRQAIETKKEEIKLLKEQLDLYIKINIENTDSFNSTDAKKKGVKPKKKAKTKKKDNKEIEDLSKDHAKILMDLDFKISEYNRETDEATKQRILKGIDEKIKAQQKADAEMLELIQENLDAQERMFDEADKEDEERQRRKIERLQGIYEVQMAMTDLMLNISDALAQKDLTDLDNKEKKQQEYFEAELKRIEESSTLGINKEKEKSRLEAENNAKKKQFEKERIEIQRRQAKFQKAMDISSIISSTALAIIKQLIETPLPAGAPFVAAIGLAGAAQLAKVIGTPLPQYFDGTDDHKGGYAIVGDKYGKELIVEPSGKTYFTPDTDTLVNLPAHSKVIPNKDISDYLMNNKIGFAPHYNESKIEFDEVTSELKLLRKELKGKNMSMSVINYGDFYGYIQKKIK